MMSSVAVMRESAVVHLLCLFKPERAPVPRVEAGFGGDVGDDRHALVVPVGTCGRLNAVADEKADIASQRFVRMGREAQQLQWNGKLVKAALRRVRFLEFKTLTSIENFVDGHRLHGRDEGLTAPGGGGQCSFSFITPPSNQPHSGLQGRKGRGGR